MPSIKRNDPKIIRCYYKNKITKLKSPDTVMRGKDYIIIISDVIGKRNDLIIVRSLSHQ